MGRDGELLLPACFSFNPHSPPAGTQRGAESCSGLWEPSLREDGPTEQRPSSISKAFSQQKDKPPQLPIDQHQTRPGTTQSRESCFPTGWQSLEKSTPVIPLQAQLGDAHLWMAEHNVTSSLKAAPAAAMAGSLLQHIQGHSDAKHCCLMGRDLPSSPAGTDMPTNTGEFSYNTNPAQVCMNTRCYLWAHTAPGMHTYRADLTCVLRLQVEEPGKRQPLHLSGGQNVIPEEREREDHWRKAYIVWPLPRMGLGRKRFLLQRGRPRTDGCHLPFQSQPCCPHKVRLKLCSQRHET